MIYFKMIIKKLNKYIKNKNKRIYKKFNTNILRCYFKYVSTNVKVIKRILFFE